MNKSTAHLTDGDKRVIKRAAVKRGIILLFMVMIFLSSVFIMYFILAGGSGDGRGILTWIIAIFYSGMSGLICLGLARQVRRLRQDLDAGQKTVESGTIEEKGSAGQRMGRFLKVDGKWLSVSITLALKAKPGETYECHTAPISGIVLGEFLL